LWLAYLERFSPQDLKSRRALGRIALLITALAHTPCFRILATAKIATSDEVWAADRARCVHQSVAAAWRRQKAVCLRGAKWRRRELSARTGSPLQWQPTERKIDMSVKGEIKEGAGFIKEEMNEHGKSPESQKKAQEGRDLRNEGRMEDGKAPKTTKPGTGHPE
jgi:hypothetical protein